ncbi:MAG: hypothetical protein K1X54_01505 [Flavobacteriales bacterium]|nr:hypothetical protein [Flavobacteriales bacterium]
MKYSCSTKHKSLFLIIALIISVQAASQSSVNSAYSRYGIGLLQPSGTFTHAGMGGACTALSDGISINYANPATYSFLELTTLQIGARGSFSSMYTSDNSTKVANGQVSELGFGFKKAGSKYGFAMAVTPYSVVDYQFRSETTLNDSVSASTIYQGSGGLNRALIGISRSFRLSKTPEKKNQTSTANSDSVSTALHQLAVGFNFNCLFGNINRTNTVFLDYNQYFATHDYNNLHTRGFFVEGGLLYKFNFGTQIEEKKRINKSSSLTLGLNYSMDCSLLATYDKLITLNDTISNRLFIDTSYQISGERGRLRIPQKISAGITWKHYNKKAGTFIVSADVKLQDWSQYELALPTDFNLDDGLKSSTQLSLGMEYRPLLDLNSDLLHRMHYRLGVRQYNSSLILSDHQIIQQGVTAGLSIPVIKSTSKFHLAAEYGVMGTTDAGLVQEKYLNFSVGFTLTPSIFDKWFRQIKYD